MLHVTFHFPTVSFLLHCFYRGFRLLVNVMDDWKLNIRPVVRLEISNRTFVLYRFYCFNYFGVLLFSLASCPVSSHLVRSIKRCLAFSPLCRFAPWLVRPLTLDDSPRVIRHPGLYVIFVFRPGQFMRDDTNKRWSVLAVDRRSRASEQKITSGRSPFI